MTWYQRFLSDPADWETLKTGIGIVKEIASQKALDGFRGPEIQPKDESLDAVTIVVHDGSTDCIAAAEDTVDHLSSVGLQDILIAENQLPASAQA